MVCRECLGAGKVNMASASSVPSATKDRSIALILEILPGLFGFLGFGWIYAGNNNTGILFLIGFLAWHLVIVLPISLITAGIGLCVTIPIDLIVIGVSAASLNNHTLQHPELFK
jgi:TM2 domain-containing membrane protein YozV